jgi:hypothetical protein
MKLFLRGNELTKLAQYKKIKSAKIKEAQIHAPPIKNIEKKLLVQTVNVHF